MSERDFFNVSADISPVGHMGTDRIDDFRMSDFQVTDPSYYDEIGTNEYKHDSYYVEVFRFIIERELIDNFNLNSYLDFHYNFTKYKNEFLDMIEFDILAKMFRTPNDETFYARDTDYFMTDISRKLRVEKWLKIKRDAPPSVITPVAPSVQPLARHWALFFFYWRITNRKDIPVYKAVIEFCYLFNRDAKSETIRKEHNKCLFRNEAERRKYQEEIKFIIGNFSNLDRSWIELAKKDILP